MNELPLIGISTYRDEASWGLWHQVADIQFAQYADAVVECTAVPVLLTPAPAHGDDLAAAATAVVARLDGLIIAGGADIDPERYGATPHPTTGGIRPDRDAWELALLDAADTHGLPTLGICRGMQLMAVHAGGTLQQHTPDEVGHTGHSPGGEVFGTTEVSLERTSRLAAVQGDTVQGPCHHHQSVATHPGFEVTGRAADGSIEAMERIVPESDPVPNRFCLGVQWHPEMGPDHAPIAALVHAARDAPVE
ncbi:glutamine amidotransferase [Flexivirga endophytica]|uniref:Glutamine amidotransferase n=1 Tax=Flexivirga endophytica TaxID=1849103 RepID=A0A916SXF0_9MICO|nr:gamma-glutamyl-gamma-aminobutyrate hydrolase family protein [Flexivirga endophytica]GGB22238.1 glutamine amidotransferase [Flexivirga endophytica]GHB56191.1 glutamine amidotransferase [Flexivirga endophytica]